MVSVQHESNWEEWDFGSVTSTTATVPQFNASWKADEMYVPYVVQLVFAQF